MTSATPPPTPSDLKDTDRCVLCGLCLAHCPTYRLTRHEGDSPRGRLVLMQGLDRGELEVSQRLLEHLDRCLECGACEAMCPSGVPFTRLMDAARARLEPRRPRPLRARLYRALGLAALRTPARLRLARGLLRLYRGSGLGWALERTGLLKPLGLSRAHGLLPSVPSPILPAAGVETRDRGRIQLFLGCMGPLVDQPTLDASRWLLARLGYSVETPRRQGCCGALYLHNGDAAGAAAAQQRNLRAFDPGAPLIGVASGCSAHLRGYPGPLGRQVRDILEFLCADPRLAALQPRRLPATVAVHIPCTLRNRLGGADLTQRLLTRIPELHLVPISGEGECCGAAGSYMLTQPELADRLRAQLLERLAASGARILVSANIGCALHLAAGARTAGLPLEVLHPVSLLARQLDSPRPET